MHVCSCEFWHRKWICRKLKNKWESSKRWKYCSTTIAHTLKWTFQPEPRCHVRTQFEWKRMCSAVQRAHCLLLIFVILSVIMEFRLSQFFDLNQHRCKAFDNTLAATFPWITTSPEHTQFHISVDSSWGKRCFFVNSVKLVWAKMHQSFEFVGNFSVY